MGTSNYSDEFKRDAVHQITVRGQADFERRVKAAFEEIGLSYEDVVGLPTPAFEQSLEDWSNETKSFDAIVEALMAAHALSKRA